MRRPRTTLAIFALVVGVALVLIATRLEVRASNLDLVDPELPTVADFVDLAQTFGTPNVLVVALEGRDPGALAAAADSLAPRLARVPGVRAVDARWPGEASRLRELGRPTHFMSRDGRLAFLFVQPADPTSNATLLAPLVAAVHAEALAARLDASGIGVGFTGLPEYALDDREIIEREVSRLTLVSATLVLALWVVGYASLLRPLLAMLALTGAALLTLGMASLWPGYLTLLSALAASILFGMGDDFGVHLIDQIEARVTAGDDEPTAVASAARTLARSLGSGAAAITVAFLALLGSGFRGFAELGALAAGGVVVCLLVMVTVLPAGLALVPRAWLRPRRVRGVGAAAEHVGGLLRHGLGRPWPALLVTLAGAAVLLWRGLPPFVGDYLALEPVDSEAVRLEREMVARSELSPQFAVVMVGTRREALEVVSRLRTRPEIGEVHSIAQVEQLTALLRPPDAGAEDPRLAVDLARLRARFASSDGRFAVHVYPRGDVWDPGVQRPFLESIEAVAADVEALRPAGSTEAAGDRIVVSGMPVLGHFMIQHSLTAFRRASWLGFLGVLAVLAVDLRRPITVFLALVPLFVGALWLLAGMQLAGVAWNPLSVMAVPVVLGYGVAGGVHVVHRYRDECGDMDATLRGSGHAVLLSTATTLASFAPLCTASHRGLASFAVVLALGVAATLVGSLVVLPAALARWAPPHRS